MEQPTMSTATPKKKIAFVTNVGYSLFREEIHETYGGGQIDLYILAKEIISRGQYDAAMVFLDYGQPAEELIDGIHLVKSYPPRQPGNTLRQFITACRRLWSAMKRANADIYFHEGADFEIAITRIFCTIYRRKYIFRCANIIDVDGRYHRAHPLHGKLFSFGLNGAHAIIAQTKDQEQLLHGQGRTVQIIENMYPLPEKISTASTLPAIWVGRMTKVKQPDLFLQLVRKFPEKKFIMLGPVDSVDQDYAADIQRQLASLPNVTYHTKVPFHSTAKFFAEASLLINTSTYEGFPLTFVQAMANGLPILTAGIDPDQVVSTSAGLVATGVDDLEKKFLQLYQPEIWHKFSQSARIYAEQHYAPAMIVPKYERLFLSVLA